MQFNSSKNIWPRSLNLKVTKRSERSRLLNLSKIKKNYSWQSMIWKRNYQKFQKRSNKLKPMRRNYRKIWSSLRRNMMLKCLNVKVYCSDWGTWKISLKWWSLLALRVQLLIWKWLNHQCLGKRMVPISQWEMWFKLLLKELVVCRFMSLKNLGN